MNKAYYHLGELLPDVLDAMKEAASDVTSPGRHELRNAEERTHIPPAGGASIRRMSPRFLIPIHGPSHV